MRKRLRACLVFLMALGWACSPGSSSGGSSGGGSSPGGPTPPNAPSASYFELAKHYAPEFYQDINQNDGAQGVSDLPLRLDYDMDWQMDNNWDNFSALIDWMKNGSLGGGGANAGGYDLGAYVYYSVVESNKNFFITYMVFHPRDWTDGINLPFSNEEHENDVEGAMVVVEKDGTSFGKFVCVSTQAHDHFLLYTNETNITARGKAPIRDGLLFTASHPRLYIEAEGHGIASGKTKDEITIDSVLGVYQIKITGIYVGPAGPTSNFRGGDGFIYKHTGTAEFAYDSALGYDPNDPVQRTVGYALLPIEDFWVRRTLQETFVDLQELAGTRYTGGAKLGFSFHDGDSNIANPPWGWKGEDIKEGDFFFDPAFAVWKHYNFDNYPGGFDSRPDGTYQNHPYLKDIAPIFWSGP